MATNDDQTTDRHDESDRDQFGDHPTIEGTAFEEAHCARCGTYVVQYKGYRGRPFCIDCRRAIAGINWGSGDNIGDHHPSPPSTPPEQRPSGDIQHNILTKTGNGKTEYRWGCLYCMETGTADNPTHATALHKIHIGYACPGAPGLYPTEIKLRLARRKAREHLYPQDVPPFTPNKENES